ncbi:MAG TPA: folylpolyglutamate synthase/dihydrofolate synthase family protein [Thermoplasmata archaeon]|jgi:dihydrofolate synthase/folylpolyglutamate synthase|nr:folylpolyglutamate synthase/dihydrofolate synthase family protein [Thermoplasmata archaeon]
MPRRPANRAQPVPPEYAESVARLAERRRFGSRPGLETIRAVLEGLGNPQRSFRSIHVTGSKGKGSVTAIAASILAATGAKVGRFTSPHLVSYRERIRVNDEMIPHESVALGLQRVEALADELRSRAVIDREPTFFEVTTALAFDWFREQKVDAAVVEVGLGGRLDSTNLLDAAVGVISSVELEHTEVLGPTLTAIAHEKAGILHPGMTAVVGEAKDEPLREIDRIADQLGVPVLRLGAQVSVGPRTLDEHGQEFAVTTPHRNYPAVRLPLHGTVQAGNTALAIAATERFQEALGRPLTPRHVQRGLSAVRWRGRMERVGRRPEGWLDVAHTPESARALAQSLAEIAPLADPAGNAVVFGCLADKNVNEILESLSPLATTVIVVPVRSARALSAEEMHRSAVGRFPRVVVAPDVETAWKLARAAADPDGFVLVTGSDYLVGELIGQLEGRPDDEPDLSDPGVVTPAAEASR